MNILKRVTQLGLVALIGAMMLVPATASADQGHHRHRYHMVKRVVWRHGHKHVIWVRVRS